MAPVLIETRGVLVRLESHHLVLLSPKGEDGGRSRLRTVPLAEVEHLILVEGVQITTEALCELSRAGLSIQLVDRWHKPVGSVASAGHKGVSLRLKQYRKTDEPGFALGVARQLIGAKIANQKRLLQKLQSNRPTIPAAEVAMFSDYERAATRADQISSLLGVEGASTALYFSVWARFLPAEFPFERRSTRPPHNAVNACLSFISTLVYAEICSQLHQARLDASIGLMHVPDDSRNSLALDFMEPFRPAFVEALTLRLFAHRMLGGGDFEPVPGGIYLGKQGRRTVLEQFTRRKSRSFWSEQWKERTTLTGAITRQIASFRSALDSPEALTPFRLN